MRMVRPASDRGDKLDLNMAAEPKNRWFILVIFMLAHAVNDGFGWIIPPLLPFMREHFHLSYTQMGSFFALFRFTGSILQVPAAYLVHWCRLPP
jgi:fucose permease